MKSVFPDKSIIPSDADLKIELSATFDIWKNIEAFVIQLYPEANAAWHFSGEKYGWSYRISDPKRVIIYLLPRKGFFKVAFVFGNKAMDQVVVSDISQLIIDELMNAKAYAEGRGIRIDVVDQSNYEDICRLIRTKISH